MIKKIEYEDKQAIQNDDSIQHKNKVTADDMNEIKNVVNTNASETEEINKKNTEQDTEIQTNAKNIEVNQNNIKALQVENAEIKAENERLKSDIESISLVGQVEGESIDLNDSSNARFLKFGIGGNHSQETREGYNLYNYKNVEKNKKIDGDTGNLIDDGNFCFSGYIEVKENTNYIRRDVGTLTNVMLDENKNRIGKTSGVSFTTPNNCKYVAFNISRAKYDDNSYLKFVMNEGTELKAFEEYGKSPSPDYPSEIKTVARSYSPYGMGSVEINVVNKNLLNIANTEETTKNGITYSIKNRILKLNGTATTNFDIQLSKNIKIKKGKYTHSASYIQSGLYISYDNLGYSMISSTVGKKRIFELAEDATYKTYFIWIDKGTVLNNVEIKLQLEVGDTATDFVEHQSQTAIMPVQQDMLKGDYISNVEHHEWGKVVFDGTEKLALSGATTDELLVAVFDISGAEDGYGCSNYFVYSSTIKQNSIAVYNNGKNLRFCVNKNEFLNLEAFKAWLKSKYDEGNPVIVYYKLAEPINLELISEQKAVAKQIKETLHTYKNVTHICSDDETSPIVNVEYAKDLNTIISNIQALVLNNASEEVSG